jgi:hypothetical protein
VTILVSAHSDQLMASGCSGQSGCLRREEIDHDILKTESRTSPSKKICPKSLRFLTAILVAAMAVPMPQVLAEPAARTAMEFIIDFLTPSKKKSQTMGSQDFKGPANRASEVKHLRLCPRKLLLYVGEAFTLVPLPA